MLDALGDGDYNGNMPNISVSLSPDLQRHVDARAEGGGYADSSAYLRALAERDQAAYRADVARVQALIDEGLASGVCEKNAFEVLDEVIAGIRQPDG